MSAHQTSGYSDPYFSGIGLGLVLLAAYVTVGHGVGASGAFATLVANATAVVAPVSAAASPASAPYLANGRLGVLGDWFVVELAGIAAGGFCSAWIAGRLRAVSEHGPRVNGRQRMCAAVGGGTLMGIGAKFARGCTSGQALTGGALLSMGSWIFIAACFGSAYLIAPFVRRLWR